MINSFVHHAFACIIVTIIFHAFIEKISIWLSLLFVMLMWDAAGSIMVNFLDLKSIGKD